MKIVKLITLLVRHFNIRHAEVMELIHDGRVRVNGKAVSPSMKLEIWDEVAVDQKIIRPAAQFTYIRFYKPRGIECTLNTEIEHNLTTAFQFPKKLFPVGRLDKDSEGLLLLTDDGRIYDAIAQSEREKEKEYYVTIDKPVTTELLSNLAAGVEILSQQTKPAITQAVADDPNTFIIILRQGLNRQIRRMCMTQHAQVLRLLRTRIVCITLENLRAGEWNELTEEEINELFQRLNVVRYPNR
ncbi:MAG: pseudouridine synthase [Bacteroidia bacterium]